MKWFKKIINFFSYIEEDEFDEYEEFNEKNKSKKQELEHQEPVDQHVPLERKVDSKNNFRFPIIQDQELDQQSSMQGKKESSNPFTPYSEHEFPYNEKGKLQQEVYDVEQPKIREILENRRKTVKYSYQTTYRPKSIKVYSKDNVANSSVKRKNVVNSPPKKQEEKIEINYSRRRFIPSDVPSPVYGFQNIKTLEKVQPTEEKITPYERKKFEEVQEKINIEKNPLDEKQILEEKIPVLHEKEDYQNVSQINQLLQRATEDDEQLLNGERETNPFSEIDINLHQHNDNQWIEKTAEYELDEQEDEFHESIVAKDSYVDNCIKENDEEEKLPTDIEEQELENSLSKQSKVEQSNKESGSKLPFNVLMLKSDKKKMAQNMTVNSPSTISNTVAMPKSKNQEIEGNEDKTKNLYSKPSIQFLTPPEAEIIDQEWMEAQADKLIEALSYFQVSAEVQSIMQGPAVTQFEITVAHGIKVSKIRNLADDLKLALAAKDIRIQAPIPGRSTIGIEIPNRISRAVRISEIVASEKFLNSESPLEAALGLDLTGNPVTIDLRKMPHGLIAGATGSGKSVCINSILTSLLIKANPDELKLMLIDPKIVELAPYNNIPHLVSPVITDVKAATAALKWAVEEMERRYQLFASSGVRDLPRFNKWAKDSGEQPLPYILIVIDELADLMMMSPTDVEDAICRIAQKARACGIHMIVATQRPSVDVITGLIKSNIPTRIAFAVSSQIDSRTILDQQGAERLLGRGDMLYLGNGMSAPIRLQGTFVTDDEIEAIVDYIKEQGEPHYFFEQEELLKKAEMVEEQDELFEEVCRFVAEQGTASTSSIQRRYHIGYNRAARLIDMLEQQGFISSPRGSKPREVYITLSDLDSIFNE